jgi:DNA-binding NarL/FixJ family response regulator
MQPPAARLLLADRRPIAATGLVAVLEEYADLAVKAICHGVAELSAALGPGIGLDALIVDVEMFDGDASRTLAAVRALDPSVAVLLFITRVDEALIGALGNGRVSCVSVYSDAGALVSSLRALLGGQTLLPEEVQRALMDTLREPPPSDPVLTLREEQVLALAATGLTISQIALRLHISHSTAKTHLLRVYEKLGAPNRSAAVATALAHGMLHVGSPALDHRAA